MSWSKKLKRYLCSKKLKQTDFWLMLAVLLLFVCCYTVKMPFYEVFRSKTEITLGYSAKQGDDGRFYVLDNGHERLICFDEEGNIKFSIENPSDEKSNLLYIDDFFVTENGIYVSATEWNEMAIKREAILAFDANGRYVDTLAERDYSENRTNKHRFYGICEQDGAPQYAECLADTIRIGDWEIPYENAFNAVSDVVFVGDTVYILNKNGTIQEFTDGSRSGNIIYSLADEKDENVVPYRLAADEEGNIYFTDIRNREVRLVLMSGKGSTVLCTSTDSLTVNITKKGEYLLLESLGLQVVGEDETDVYFLLKKNVKMILHQAVWILALVLLGMLLLLLMIRLFNYILRKKHSTSRIVSFWVIGTVAVVSILLCGMLMKSFAASYKDKIEEQIESAAYMVANQIQGSDIEQVEETGGFGGEAYNRLCEVMEKSFTMDIAFYRQIYCNILKVPKDGGKGYAVAYLDQSVGAFFPLDDGEWEELQKVYETGNSVWNQKIANISGTYLSVKVPVYDDAEKICGAVEVGVETYVLTDTLRALMRKILMSIVVLLMLVWLVSVEVMAFANNYEFYRKNRSDGERDIMPGHLIRLLIFVVFAAYNMTATFLPVYLMRRTDIFREEIRELAGALPITVNIFIIGIMSLFCANLVRKYGIRKTMAFSALCSLAGNLLIYLLPNFYTICIGLILDGIGVGLITNAVYVMLTYIRGEVSRTWGLSVYNGAYLSGINFGMLMGSVLAVSLGQRFVFFIVALTWFLILVLTRYMMPKMEEMLGVSEEREEEKQKVNTSGISAGRFVFSRPVFSFVVLIQNTYIIFGSFVFYFVPLYCGEQGYSETICSLLIMLYSEVAVLCTNGMMKRATKKFGSCAMYVALGMNIAALAVFVALQNMVGMVAALLFMGLGASYGKPVQQKYFLSLDKVKKYGEDKSMGIYNFSENIGESLGPVVFGRLMTATQFRAVTGGFCAGIAGLGFLHYLLNRKEIKDENQRKEI